jgi:hypothetical protein
VLFWTLQDIDEGKLWKDTPAPAIAVNYWRLPKGATMRELILAIRADEATHSHVNHTFSNLHQVGWIMCGAEDRRDRFLPPRRGLTLGFTKLHIKAASCSFHASRPWGEGRSSPACPASGVCIWSRHT